MPTVSEGAVKKLTNVYTVTKDGTRLFDLKHPGIITVTSAKYGVLDDPTRTVDVKPLVEKMVAAGERRFAVNRMLSHRGDPAFKVAKTLRIDYEMGGIPYTVMGKDGTEIAFEYEAAPSVAIPIGDDKERCCIDFHESGNYELTFGADKKRTETVTLPEPLNLDAEWTVAFPHKTIKFDKLMSWTDSADETIKFFSGTATYTKTFSIAENLRQSGLRLVLDLGQAEMMAQVELNGKNLGVLWKTDKVIDVTEIVKSGENHLKISVTNSWPNRLIGDATLPASDDRNGDGSLKSWPQWLLDGKADPNGRTTFCMWNIWKKDDALVPSGLIGPVRLLPIKRVIIE
jgi:hypothetical protein